MHGKLLILRSSQLKRSDLLTASRNVVAPKLRAKEYSHASTNASHQLGCYPIEIDLNLNGRSPTHFAEPPGCVAIAGPRRCGIAGLFRRGARKATGGIAAPNFSEREDSFEQPVKAEMKTAC